MVRGKLTWVTVAALLAVATAFGQSGDFTVKGKVVSGGQNLSMATITYTSIAKRLSWDFSKADGSFGGGTSTTVPQPQDARITLFADAPVSVDIFDIGGKKVGAANGRLDKGTYLIQPFYAKLSQSMYVLKIKAGDKVICQKLVPANCSKTGFTIALSSSSAPGVLAKKLAAVDTVRVGKTGYAPQFVAITTYTDDIGTVTLTKINIDSIVNAYFSKLNQNQIVGQLAMPPSPDNGAWIASSTVSGYACGSIFGGGGALSGKDATGAADAIDGYQKAMMSSSVKIPILAAFDFVHGASALPGATFLPHNLAMGAIQDTLLMQKAFRVQALEIRGCGCNWGFGPCIAVIRNDRWGRAYEGFCETPERTQIMARHAVLGCQTTDLSLPMAYAACAKHFAGDGNTANGTNQGTTEGPDATARAINLPGYSSAVQTGVATIMPSFSAWCDGTPMHFNGTLMNGWLKSTAGGGPNFQGFVVSDWAAGAGNDNWKSSIEAGVDVPMAPTQKTDIIGAINGYYGSDQARIQDACKRVLRVKAWMNLFSPSQYITDRRLTALVGCQAHRDIARACVRASQVLLKNSGNVIPIPKTANVALLGDAADNVGLQCGGWTVSWQGQSGGIPGGGGTSVKTGVQAVCKGTVSTSGYTNSDYVIAFLSETPYAETDFPDLSLTGKNSSGSNASVISQIAAAHAAQKKVVVVLIAGRVLDITSVIDNCDAFVWACLPGTEGNGISDVLFGDYKFTGKLPVTWPMNSAQEPINSGDGKTGRFAYGFGLTD